MKYCFEVLLKDLTCETPTYHKVNVLMRHLPLDSISIDSVIYRAKRTVCFCYKIGCAMSDLSFESVRVLGC